MSSGLDVIDPDAMAARRDVGAADDAPGGHRADGSGQRGGAAQLRPRRDRLAHLAERDRHPGADVVADDGPGDPHPLSRIAQRLGSRSVTSPALPWNSG